MLPLRRARPRRRCRLFADDAGHRNSFFPFVVKGSDGASEITSNEKKKEKRKNPKQPFSSSSSLCTLSSRSCSRTHTCLSQGPVSQFIEREPEQHPKRERERKSKKARERRKREEARWAMPLTLLLRLLLPRPPSRLRCSRASWVRARSCATTPSRTGSR